MNYFVSVPTFAEILRKLFQSHRFRTNYLFIEILVHLNVVNKLAEIKIELQLGRVKNFYENQALTSSVWCQTYSVENLLW